MSRAAQGAGAPPAPETCPAQAAAAGGGERWPWRSPGGQPGRWHRPAGAAHAHTHSHTRTPAHALSRTLTLTHTHGPGYGGCQAIGPAGRGREGGVSGISGLDRCESISGHFPAAFPAPLPLCVQETQPPLPAQQRHSVAVSHTFLLWSLGSGGEEEQGEQDSLLSSAGAAARREQPGHGQRVTRGLCEKNISNSCHGGGRARVGRGMRGPCHPQGRRRVCPEPAWTGRGNPHPRASLRYPPVLRGASATSGIK